MDVIEDAEGSGENVVEKKTLSEEVFLQELVTQHIDKYAQFYVQYLKFRDIVTVEPLMPDQKALKELSEH
jgi:hypothetical protein